MNFFWSLSEKLAQSKRLASFFLAVGWVLKDFHNWQEKKTFSKSRCGHDIVFSSTNRYALTEIWAVSTLKSMKPYFYNVAFILIRWMNNDVLTNVLYLWYRYAVLCLSKACLCWYHIVKTCTSFWTCTYKITVCKFHANYRQDGFVCLVEFLKKDCGVTGSYLVI